MNHSLYDLYPYLYKSTDAKIHKIRSIDKTGWDDIFEPTYTAIEHSHRLLSEWFVDTVSLLASMALCVFLWKRKKLLLEFAVAFATFSAQILYWPFYLLSTWQTMFLLFGKAPEYPSILHCSLLRHFVLACFQSAGLITVPIAVDHICLVFLKKRLKIFNMIAFQVFITFSEFLNFQPIFMMLVFKNAKSFRFEKFKFPLNHFQLFFTLAHLAVGDITINDICAQWIASPDVFLISMSFNNTLLLFAVLTNFTLVMVQIFEKFVFKKCGNPAKLCLNYSTVLLLQSSTELILSFPLTVRQWKVLLGEGIRHTNYFCAYGYMFSSCIFMVPLLSMLCIPKFRLEFSKLFGCSKLKATPKSSGTFNFQVVYTK
ncbi:LOW QUALITY PROTEIN: Protein CBG03529 [Caenorhabditis briggsae]|uniref:Protein CBG03529 n=1 Tax=Caenorhabditis briggsae TaxID=6238 RepID=A8WV98_CAEBR|nr:LOW QUALITY PROTEIN: Protein CBG03529 [Caenorhabditis briggsae]CAP24409.1 Protein CBG03529 [Caenorhabditis briggsae]